MPEHDRRPRPSSASPEFRAPTISTICARRPSSRSATAAVSAGSMPPPRRCWRPTGKACCWCRSGSSSSARLDGVVAGSAQLVAPPRNNEAQAYAGTSSPRPSSRPGRAATASARKLIQAVETRRARLGYRRAEPRRARDPARRDRGSTRRLGFQRWGTHPCLCARRRPRRAGHYYYKTYVLRPARRRQPRTEAQP